MLRRNFLKILPACIAWLTIGAKRRIPKNISRKANAKMIKQQASATGVDPLAQRQCMGWKMMHVWRVVNDGHFRILDGFEV